MTIRTRLTLWFTSILFVALVIMGAFLYYELVLEPRSQAEHPQSQGQEPDDESDDLVGILLGCGLPALALSLGGGWWMVRKALAPVAALTQAAERLSEHNLGQRLPRSGAGDELDRLTEVFNAMTQRLEQSFQRIREFSLHASHELKTPLTVLRAELETGLQEPNLPTEQRARAESQLAELQRLTTIVDGLTLLTKADAGLVPLKLEAVSWDGLVRDSFEDAQLLAQAAGLQVELTACEPAPVLGEPHRLRQLLLNLIDNAVKYTPAGGAISMTLQRRDGEAELRIANTGPGIPPEQLPRVFDRFFRGDPAHSSAIEGCGLGLSIAQWIVSVHKGSIDIASVPSKLTTVTVRLPLLGSEARPSATGGAA